MKATQPGTEPAIQASALIGYQTSNLSLCRITPSQLHHTGQGDNLTFYLQADKYWFVKSLIIPLQILAFYLSVFSPSAVFVTHLQKKYSSSLLKNLWVAALKLADFKY